jgi:5-methylcytosine-specific restriction endonuclease McrA
MLGMLLFLEEGIDMAGRTAASNPTDAQTAKSREYFDSLEAMSLDRLDRSAEQLARAEKRNMTLLIAHLAEMSRRKGELECGYKNLFEYGVLRLGLSEGSVARRLQVANVSRRFPQILVALLENRVSLTVASLLAPHLRDDNADELLSDCAGKTKREVDEYLVARKPKPVFKPSIRKTPNRDLDTSGEEARSTNQSKARDSEVRSAHAGTESTASSSCHSSQAPNNNLIQPAEVNVFNFRFAADRKFKDKLDRLAEVLGIENPQRNMAKILDYAIDTALEKKDPKRRLARRRAKANAKAKRTTARKSCPGKISEENGPSPLRHVPDPVRERVHERANYQCQYVAKNGKRCSSRTGLEIEHARPFAVFGTHDEQFLMLLCKRHNRLAAERFYGTDFVREKIDKRRNGRRRPGVI